MITEAAGETEVLEINRCVNRVSIRGCMRSYRALQLCFMKVPMTNFKNSN
jgi:hypothetical protein